MQKLTLGMMCCLLAAGVEAETIQVDFSSVFNHDAIGNTGDDANDASKCSIARSKLPIA